MKQPDQLRMSSAERCSAVQHLRFVGRCSPERRGARTYMKCANDEPTQQQLFHRPVDLAEVDFFSGSVVLHGIRSEGRTLSAAADVVRPRR